MSEATLNTPDDAIRRFGQVLRACREKAGLTQRQMAKILGISQSALARLETAQRKPPRIRSFYERLQQIPGITQEEIASLLSTDNARYWLVPEDTAVLEPQIREAAASSEALTVSVDHFHVEFRVFTNSDAASREDVETLRQIIKPYLQHIMQDFLRLNENVRQTVEETLSDEISAVRES